MIRVVIVTDIYRNLRGERLLIVTIETPDEGRRLRASVGPAFPASATDPSADCLLACQLATDAPLVRVEFDADRDNLALVAEMPVVDGTVTSRQLIALIDGLVVAAERWQDVSNALHARRTSKRLKRPKNGAA